MKFSEGPIYFDKRTKSMCVLYKLNTGEEILRDISSFLPNEIVEYCLKTKNTSLLFVIGENQKIKNFTQFKQVYNKVKQLPMDEMNLFFEKLNGEEYIEKISYYAYKNNLSYSSNYPDNVIDIFVKQEKKINYINIPYYPIIKTVNPIITKYILSKKQPFIRCGKYNGQRFNKVANKIINFTPEETAFGNYLYAIQIVTDYISETANIPLSEISQEEIDNAINFLDYRSKEFIDKENLKIHYDANDFNKNTNIQNLSPLMPYVLQFQAIKQGYIFKERDFLTDNKNNPNKFVMPLRHHDGLDEKDMILSICQKTGSIVKAFPKETKFL